MKCMCTMTGIELIFSNVCNLTSCQMPEPEHAPAHLIDIAPFNLEMEYKAAREMINGQHLQIGSFNVIIFKDGPFSGSIKDELGDIIPLGIAFRLVDILSEKFNFTYDVVFPPREVSTKKGRELWLVKMLIKRKIDLAAAFIQITPTLQNLVTFDLETDTFNCLFEKDSRYPFHVDPVDILQPFQTTVWVCFALMLALYITCLVLLTRLRSMLIGDDEDPFTLSSSISYVYRVCTQQDVQQSPKTNMTRMLLMTWSIFVFLVSTYYAANLSKSFTLNSVAKRDLLKFEWAWLEENGIVLDVNDAKTCRELVSINHYRRRPRAFAYQKNTTLKNLFSRQIKNLYYTGILEMFYKNTIQFVDRVCPVVMSSAMRQLGFRDLMANYYCWLVGVTAGLGAFFIELLVAWVKKSKGAPAAEVHLHQMDKSQSVESDDEDYCSSSNQPSPSLTRRTVNGRQYLVARTKQGEPRLVPEDTLSALLFDLNSYEPTDCGNTEDQC